MISCLIRPMESADIPRVAEIDRASMALYWPERSFHFEVEKNESSRPFVAVDADGTIRGFIVFWLILDEAHLATFAVDPETRRQGIGAALLDHGLRICYEGGARVSFLEVRAGNVPAISLYRSRGYETAGVRRKYYQDNHEDALMMNLETEAYQKLMDEGLK